MCDLNFRRLHHAERVDGRLIVGYLQRLKVQQVWPPGFQVVDNVVVDALSAAGHCHTLWRKAWMQRTHTEHMARVHVASPFIYQGDMAFTVAPLNSGGTTGPDVPDPRQMPCSSPWR